MSALSHVTILDLTHMLSGPYASQLLADMGANCIKVEPPAQGEGTRKLLANDEKYSIDGVGAYFLTLSRNKKSVAIDLKKPEGLALFYELAGTYLYWLSGVGALWGFHVTFTVATLLHKQPDIQACGRLFSYTVIFIANVIGIALFVVLISPVGFLDLCRIMVKDFAYAYAAVFRFYRDLSGQ